MARGFTQRPGVHFFETFSSVAGFDVERTVVAISAMRGWDLRTLDFKQAHLNAALSVDIWLELPVGSIVKALNVIYGLKQSVSECYQELHNAILNGGWKSIEHE